jgi:hypothetical protein
MLNPVEILNSARKEVPAVNYALGLAGLAAAGAIIIHFVGKGQGAVPIIGLVFVGTVLLFLFSTLLSSGSVAIRAAAIVLLWAVLLFFVTFLSLTVSAFSGFGPKPWADFLGIHNAEPVVPVVPEAPVLGADPEPAKIQRVNFLVDKTAPAGTPAQQAKVFSDPHLGDRQIDGCITSSFFPVEFSQQCREEAQTIVATMFCRSMHFKKSTTHNTQMFKEGHQTFVLKLEEAPGDSIAVNWQPAEASGFIFTQIQCE